MEVEKEIEKIKEKSKAGKCKEALADCIELINKVSNISKNTKELGDLYYISGLLKIQLEDYEGVISDCSKALEINFDSEEVYFTRGLAKNKIRDRQGAINDYTKALEINPNNEEIYIARGLTEDLLGRYQKAINDYTKIIEINMYKNKEDATIYYLRGGVYSKLNKPKKAIADYTKAINIKKDFKEALSKRGIEYHKLKYYIKAMNDYSNALKLEKKSEKKDYVVREVVDKEVNEKAIDYNIDKKSMEYEKISKENLEQAKLRLNKSEKGYLTFADILGWKGIWQRKSDDEVALVTKLLKIKKLVSSNDIKVDLISDTFVISSSCITRQIEACKKLIEECLANKLLIRGATAFGTYYTEDSVYIGQAVDEAASWHEKGEMVGIFLTDSAKIQVKSKIKDEGLKEREVETKGGKIKTYFVEWYSEKNKENFYNIMNDEIIFPELYKKYSNTEKYLEDAEKQNEKAVPENE